MTVLALSGSLRSDSYNTRLLQAAARLAPDDIRVVLYDRLAAAFTGPETDPWGKERIGVQLDGEIDRNDFGVSWNTALPGGGFLLENEVALSASFSFVKAA